MGRALVLALAAILAACSGGRGRERDPYEEPYGYDRPGDPRVDPGALQRHQERERVRLERQQENAREELLRQQRRERRQLKEAGEWDAADKREQAQKRRQQDRRFEQQDRRMREDQRYERGLDY